MDNAYFGGVIWPNKALDRIVWWTMAVCVTEVWEFHNWPPPSLQDGVLSEREFKKFFECFLRYAFFDVVAILAGSDWCGGYQILPYMFT